VRYALFPCCSSEHMAAAYTQSARAVMELFNIELTDIPDWNCCGATEYLSINRLAHYALSARNLALVPQGHSQVITSCSLCFSNLRRTDKVMHEHPDINEAVNDALAEGGLHYNPGVLRIRHFLDIFLNDVGVDALFTKVTTPLSNLRIAPFYGCMLTRPGDGFDHPEHPTSMDRILTALGATVAEFSMKSNCCGGHMPHIKAITAYELLRRILKSAQKSGADAIAVLCPVCQINLDAYQDDVNKHFNTHFNIPVLFFTQLMGLAFGLDPLALGIGKEIVSAEPVLTKMRVGRPETKEPKKRMRTKNE